MKVLRCLVFALVLAAVPALADQHPNQLKGFNPENVYSVHEIDSINTFNGNLTLTIPIGPEFPVAEGFSYRLTLYSNSNVWDPQEVDHELLRPAEAARAIEPNVNRCPDGPLMGVTVAHPHRRANAGVGWILTLGRVYEGDTEPSRNGAGGWMYESPDGSEHTFGPSNDDGVAFTWDGTYLRMTEDVVDPILGNGDTRIIEFPDGSFHTFKRPPTGRGAWLPVRFEHRGSSEKVEITYPVNTDGTVDWVIKDSHNREHRINFERKFWDGGWKALITTIDLEAFDDPDVASESRAVYQFNYHQSPIGRPEWHMPCPGFDNDAKVQFLDSVVLPDDQQSRYSFQYDESSGPLFWHGVPARAILPTGGVIEWDFLTWPKPFDSASGQVYFRSSWGVWRRHRRMSIDSERFATWRYFSLFDGNLEPPTPIGGGSPPPLEMKSVIVDPERNATVSYFSVATELTESGDWKHEEYGKPFTKHEDDGSLQKKWLSLRQYGKVIEPPSGSLEYVNPTVDESTLLQSTYVRYESESEMFNWRVAGTRVVHHDDVIADPPFNDPHQGAQWVDTLHSDFDGFGHYRVTEVRGSSLFDTHGETTTKKTTTDYNFGRGLPTPALAANWTTGVFASVVVEQGGESMRSEYCFNEFGRLSAVRSRRASAALDLLVTYEDSDGDGNVDREKYFGGDDPSHPAPAATCGDENTAPAYTLIHDGEAGVRKSTSYFGQAFKALDLDIDHSTGLPRTSRDSAGVPTTYRYNAVGQLRAVEPRGEAWTEYTYAISLTSMPHGTVTARQWPEGAEPSGVPLTETRHYYDAFGRLVQQRRRMPDTPTSEQWSVSEIEYDDAGRKVRTSVAVTGSSGNYSALPGDLESTHIKYDPLGRPEETKMPDGSISRTKYKGARRVARSVTMATTESLNTTVWNAEHYDAHGRLVRVVENALEAGEGLPADALATLYEYDEGNRLVEVNSGGQIRTFSYDGAGLLVEEDHPELAKTHYTYDARGHVLKKVVSHEDPTNLVDAAVALTFGYDTAERLRTVTDAKTNRVLKVLAYHPTLGRLENQTRHNYFHDSTYEVTDTFGYDAVTGRPTSKATDITRTEIPSGATSTHTFNHAFDYTELGAPDHVKYPTCVGCGGVANSRNLQLGYQNGYLTGIERVTTPMASGAPGITYTPSGAVYQVQHKKVDGSAGVLETFVPDPSGMARISFIQFDGLLPPPICVAPTISAHQASPEGNRTRLSVTVGGTDPFQYKWYLGLLNDTSQDVGTDPTFLTPPLTQPTDYWVEARNSCGANTRPIHVLPVICPSPPPPPVLQAMPPAFAEGEAFQLLASSTAGSSYRWYTGTGSQRNLIATTTTSTYGVTLGISEETHFSVEMQVGDCTATSNELVLAPCLKKRAVSVTMASGTNTFQLSVENDQSGVTFQWYEGTSYEDLSIPVGNGPFVYVQADGVKQYWVRMTRNCGGVTATVKSNFAVVDFTKAPKILIPPTSVTRQMTNSGDTVHVTTTVLASGEGTLSYAWYVDGASAPCAAPSETSGPEPCVPQTGPSYTWSYKVPAEKPLAVHRTVKVKVSSPFGSAESDTVTLNVVNAPPQEITSFQRMSSVYAPGHAATLFVDMEPKPLAGQHSYEYEWFEADGTPGGDKLNGSDSEILVQTSGISRFWARITGTHHVGALSYTEVTLSPTMYVHLYGNCELPPLDVSQSLTSIPDGSSTPVTFTAFCDWPGVDYQWFEGPSGDTRNPRSSDPNQDEQLTVSVSIARPYWVRASKACGAFKDSPTMTFTKGSCGPVVFNQNIASVEVPYGGNTSLQVDPVAIAGPTYTWYQGEDDDASNPVGFDRVLLLNNVTKSGRYWVKVRSQVCGNETKSFVATVRVASAPSLTPPQWQAESWTDKGTSKTLSAAAVGATGYEWFAGYVGNEDQEIDGAVSSTYATPPLTADTKYWARIHGSGTEIVDSPTLTVRVCEAPHLTFGEATGLSLYYNVVPGQWASFGIPVSGTGPLEYQWYQGEVGNTSLPVGMPVDKLKIRPLATTKYWVRVTSPCGVNGSDPRTYDSPNFLASVCPVLSAPTSARAKVMPGTSTTVSIVATGTDLTYQWYIGGSGDKTHPVVGPTATSATLTTPALNEATRFWCEVTSGQCPRASDDVTVNICEPLYQAWSGYQNKVARSQNQTLSLIGVPIDGTTGFQWYKGLSGDTSTPASTQINLGISPTETTSYWVRISHGESGCSSDTTAVTVQVCIPTITLQPQPSLINTGDAASMTVGVDLTGQDLADVTYQWYAGPSGNTSNPVLNQTSATLTAYPTVNTSYWVRVTGGCTISRDSVAALVTVCEPVAITMQPQDRNVTANFTIGASVGASGTNLTYQWYEGLSGDTSHPLVGWTNAGQDITVSETKDFWVRISGSCGAPVNSTTVKISVPPSIQTQPSGGGVVMPGTQRTLSVSVFGTQLRYEWHKSVGASDTVVGDATSSYTTPGITTNVSYYCRIFSGNNHRDSALVEFTVCSLPNLNWGSVQTQVAPSDFQVLSVSGIPAETPKAYVWYRGTTGDTANQLSTQPTLGISPTVTTSYWVRVTATDTGCWVDSTTVTVNVCRPSISTQPAASTTIDKVANPSASATLAVAANISPVTYQWYIGQPGNTTSPINGATSSSYTASPNSDTTYWVRVSGNCGVSADSTAATVIVCVAPQITQHPGSLTSPPNFSRQLSVTATGTDLTYNWFVGTTGVTTTPIGGNASAVNISPAQTTDYWVRVTGRCGTLNSNSAKISIKPTISTHPVGGPITSGLTRTLTVVASGSQLRYEWYRRSGAVDTIIAGATAASYTTPPITADTTYFARVFSGNASSDSNEAAFTVCQPRSINATGWTGVSGTQVTLHVIDNAGDEAYEWYRGATGNTSTLISNSYYVVVSPLETTQYWLRTKRTGCDADTPAITVAVCIPKITTQPQSAMIPSGTTRTLTVAATGTPTMSYQWYIGASGNTGSPIAGATSPSYTTPALTTSTTYWVRITSPQQSCSSYSVNSASAIVSVCQPPVITQQPSNQNYNGVGTVSLSVAASGDGLVYQWYEGASGVTTNPVGTNSSTLTVAPASTRWYWVRVTGTCGTLNSSAALVSVYPKILGHPADTPLCGLGASASFSVNATGTSLTYQWYRAYNGQQPVAVGTTPSITIPITQVPVQVWCEVKSGNAVKTSNAAGITEVLPTPTVYTLTKSPMTFGRFMLTSNVATADRDYVLWKWYEGALGDTSILIDSGTNQAIIVTPASLPKTYWLRVQYIDTGCFTDKAVTVP